MSKKLTLIHIASQKRFKELLTKEESNATEFERKIEEDICIQTCCGKVNIVRDNKNIIGYILREIYVRKWKILLSNNEIIVIKC